MAAARARENDIAARIDADAHVAVAADEIAAEVTVRWAQLAPDSTAAGRMRRAATKPRRQYLLFAQRPQLLKPLIMMAKSSQPTAKPQQQGQS